MRSSQAKVQLHTIHYNALSPGTEYSPAMHIQTILSRATHPSTPQQQILASVPPLAHLVYTDSFRRAQR
jgi:hypothetical protein